MSFSAFIEDHLDEIVAEWRSFAQTMLPQAVGMSHLALDDHAREMLLAIVKDMRSGQTEDERARKSKGEAPAFAALPETAAFTHGVARHLSGFEIDQLLSEFRALRASVLRFWRRFGPKALGEEAAVEEIARFNEGIDQALAESIQSYSVKVNHSRDMFLAVLGHDVRGPLSGINMAAELLETPSLAEPVRLQIALRIRRASGVIGRLTTDLLEYARSRLGSGIPVERSECNLGELCEESIDAVKAAHPEKTITAEFSGDLDTRCDVTRMQQALGNLLNNAVQHGAPGKPILVGARRDGNQCVLTVSNQGQPIPEEAFARIFEPLFRLAPQGTESSPQRHRMGLGLFIVKQIVEGHGGTVSVESSAAGTTFSIRLNDPPA